MIESGVTAVIAAKPNPAENRSTAQRLAEAPTSNRVDDVKMAATVRVVIVKANGQAIKSS